MKIKYGWVMVAIGAFMTCIAIGAMFSLAVFLQPITQATGWSHTEVSSAMTIGFLAMGAAGFGWGALSDRIGPRYVVLAGAVLLGLGLFLASRAQSALQFQLALPFFACCAAHAGPIFHTVTYAMTCGLAPLAAVTIYSVEGLAGLGGRLALGVLADRLGVKRVLIAGLLIQAVAAGAFVFASRLGEFYAVAATFGFAYGGVMPLYAVLAREYFGQRILGAVFGAAAMVSSLGMALGPAIGGWIFDTFGQYTWMYVYSGAIRLRAPAIPPSVPPFSQTGRGA